MLKKDMEPSRTLPYKGIEGDGTVEYSRTFFLNF
jgi:hypothetical protein